MKTRNYSKKGNENPVKENRHFHTKLLSLFLCTIIIFGSFNIISYANDRYEIYEYQKNREGPEYEDVAHPLYMTGATFYSSYSFNSLTGEFTGAGDSIYIPRGGYPVIGYYYLTHRKDILYKVENETYIGTDGRKYSKLTHYIARKIVNKAPNIFEISLRENRYFDVVSIWV